MTNPYFIDEDGVLQHYGVKGMKWGVRRRVNPATGRVQGGVVRRKDGDGRTVGQVVRSGAKSGGRKVGVFIKSKAADLRKDPHSDPPIGEGKRTYINKKNRGKESYTLTDDELQSRVNRMRLEKQYAELSSVRPSSVALKTAAKNAGENIKNVEKFVKSPAGDMIKQQLSQQLVKNLNVTPMSPEDLKKFRQATGM